MLNNVVRPDPPLIMMTRLGGQLFVQPEFHLLIKAAQSKHSKKALWQPASLEGHDEAGHW